MKPFDYFLLIYCFFLFFFLFFFSILFESRRGRPKGGRQRNPTPSTTKSASSGGSAVLAPEGNSFPPPPPFGLRLMRISRVHPLYHPHLTARADHGVGNVVVNRLHSNDNSLFPCGHLFFTDLKHDWMVALNISTLVSSTSLKTCDMSYSEAR